MSAAGELVADKPSKADSAWPVVASAVLAAILIVGALLGFVVVPLIEARGSGVDPWTVICHAAGLGGDARSYPSSTANPGAAPVSQVSWRPDILDGLAAGDRRAGAQLSADNCSACHGEAGVSQSAQFPVLANQSAEAIYKQLHDYRSGARSNAAMAAVVRSLSERQMIDLAAYFARDRAFHALGRRWAVPDPQAAALARRGDAARNLPACDSCHGAGAGGPLETPVLNGQHEEYIVAELQAYAKGERRNDVYGRMRTIAHKLTPGEMTRVAEYYQGLN